MHNSEASQGVIGLRCSERWLLKKQDKEGTRGVDGKARAWEEELRRRWAEGVAESGGGEEGGGGGGGGGGSTDGRHGSW